MNLSYMRFSGKGSLVIESEKEKIKRSGELIYEFMYPGENAVHHMEKH